MIQHIPALEIFLGVLGFGFSILFCTAFCRVCHRFRDNQLAREEWLRAREADRPTSVFVIPVQGGGGLSHLEDLQGRGPPRSSLEAHRPPRYSVTVGNSPPPAYSELGFKPDDLPPGYTEHISLPGYPAFPTSPAPTPTSPPPTPTSPPPAPTSPPPTPTSPVPTPTSPVPTRDDIARRS